MENIPIKNHGKTVKYVAGYMIPPGETRILPAHLVPASMRPDAPAESEAAATVNDIDAQLAEILAGNITEVRKALADVADDHLVLLAALEDKTNGGAGRKGVFEAIADTQLQRASFTELAEFEVSLKGLDEDALLAKLDEIGNDLDKAEIVQAALDALNPGDEDGQPSAD